MGIAQLLFRKLEIVRIINYFFASFGSFGGGSAVPLGFTPICFVGTGDGDGVGWLFGFCFVGVGG
jgi:hypothetical protein